MHQLKLRQSSPGLYRRLVAFELAQTFDKATDGFLQRVPPGPSETAQQIFGFGRRDDLVGVLAALEGLRESAGGLQLAEDGQKGVPVKALGEAEDALAPDRVQDRAGYVEPADVLGAYEIL